MSKGRPKTRSQRIRKNEKQRKWYLRNELERGRVPQPIKPAPWLLSLYKEFGVEYAVFIPQPWMDKKFLVEVRAEQRRIRARVRDMLPAETSRAEFNKLLKEIALKRMASKFKSA